MRPSFIPAPGTGIAACIQHPRIALLLSSGRGIFVDMADTNGTYCIVWITVGDSDAASALAQTLVRERLAACCNLLPGVRSIYRWQDEIQEDGEVLLFCKTRASLFDRLVARVSEIHSYDVPEIIRSDITGASAPYLHWMNESLSDGH